MAELRPYNPSWRDKLAAMLMGDNKASPEKRALIQGLMGSTGLGTTGMGLVDMVPGGQVLSAQEAGRQGDLMAAGIAMMPGPAGGARRGLTQVPRHIPGKPDIVKIPGVGEIPAAPIKELTDSADQYMTQVGRPGAHEVAGYPKFDEDRARQIADAFDRMQHAPGDPQVKRAYDAMIDETLGQYKSAKNAGVDVQFIKPGQPDPYAASPALGYHDLIQNGHLWTFPTQSGFGSLQKIEDNPLLKKVGPVGDLPNATANDAFRVVHDLYGHFAQGNPFFRHQGEERAWINHSLMYSPEARGAMTSETRGQNSWLNFGPYGDQNRNALSDATTFADQKIGVLPDWAQQVPEGVKPAGRIPEITADPAKAKAVFDAQTKTALSQGDQRWVPPEGPEYWPWRVKVGGFEPTQDPKTGKWFASRVKSADEENLSKAIKQAEKRAKDMPPFFTEADLTKQTQRGETFPMAERASGVPPHVTANMSADAENRIMAEAANAPDKAGKWFWTGKLENDLGQPRLDRFGAYMGATTSDATVPQNIRMGTYQMAHADQGLPPPSNPQFPYGHKRYNSTHKAILEGLQGADRIDPTVNPKGATFAGNIAGQTTDPTLDRVMMQDVIQAKDKAGKLLQAPEDGTYGAYRDWFRGIAQKHGLVPDELQGKAWVGTGSGDGKTLVENIGDRINVTSQVTGLPPDEVYRRMQTHGMPLLSAAGAVPLLLMMQNQGDQQ